MTRNLLVLCCALTGILFSGCAIPGNHPLSPSVRWKSDPVAEDDNGNVVLVISNQSYTTPAASILVEIYEVHNFSSIRCLFKGKVPVKDQHHAVSGQYLLKPGRYLILAHEFKTKTAMEFELDIPEEGRKFVNIWFWNSRDIIPSPFPFFDVRIRDQKLGII